MSSERRPQIDLGAVDLRLLSNGLQVQQQAHGAKRVAARVSFVADERGCQTGAGARNQPGAIKNARS